LWREQARIESYSFVRGLNKQKLIESESDRDERSGQRGHYIAAEPPSCTWVLFFFLGLFLSSL